MKRFAALFTTAVLIASLASTTFGAAPVKAACGTTYVVGVGESLYSIAKLCDINYVVLMDINYEISDPALIRPGQVIRLTAEVDLPQYHKPASGPAQPYGLQPDGVYIVRPGDSLARIAYLYSTTLYDLYVANPELGWQPVIIPGQAIRLPKNARQQKGWVGVSTTEPAAYSTINVRVVDFPSYAKIVFRLYEITEEEANTISLKQAGPQDIVRDDNSSLYIEANTDARGSARVNIKLPYNASSGETWIIDVFTNNIGEADTLARSPVLWVGGK